MLILPSFTLAKLLARLFIILVAIPFHEWAHCFAAHLLGDDTPERQGRLTLNPFVHIDPMGALLILVSDFGWGRAAQVNPYRMKRISNPRVAMALTALAGPFSNFILALILVLPVRMGWIYQLPLGQGEQLESILLDAVWINLGLIAFNLLPIPPLDGSRIFAGVAPPKMADFVEGLEPIAPYILLTVLFVLPMLGIDLVRWMITPLYFFLWQILWL